MSLLTHIQLGNTHWVIDDHSSPTTETEAPRKIGHKHLWALSPHSTEDCPHLSAISLSESKGKVQHFSWGALAQTLVFSPVERFITQISRSDI